MVFSPDSRYLLTGTEDGTAHLWELGAQSASTPLSLRGHEGGVTAISVSPDNRWVVTGGRDDTIRLWDLRLKDPTGTSRTLRGLESIWSGLHHGVELVAFSPDGRWLLGRAYESKLRIWDLSTGQFGSLPLIAMGCSDGGGDRCAGRAWTVASVHEGRATVNALDGESSSAAVAGTVFDKIGANGSLSPDARWQLSRQPDGICRICQITSDGGSGVCQALGANLISAQLSPGNKALITYHQGNSDLWASLWLLARLPEQDPVRVGLDPWGKGLFDRSGRWLVARFTAELWDLDQRVPQKRALSGHVDPINHVAFSSNGRWLATASTDAILLWPLMREAAWDPVRVDMGGFAQAKEGPSPQVSFSVDNRWLAAHVGDTTYLWPMEMNDIAVIARQTAGRDLSDKERAEYLRQ